MTIKKEILEKLNADSLYNETLAKASSEEERKMIQATTEQFICNIADMFGPILEQLQSNPEILSELEKAVKNNNTLFNSEPKKQDSDK